MLRDVRAGSLRASEPRAHEERPAAGRARNTDGQKKHIYTWYIVTYALGTPRVIKLLNENDGTSKVLDMG